MSIHLIAAFAGCIVAATGTGMLAMRLTRPPRLVMAFWMLALLGLAVALGAQALGYHNAFGPDTFRAMELGGQVVAPLALCLGLTEVAGRSLPARFAARLLLSALALIAVVILATDPLSGAKFSAAWPEPAVYYQIIPNKLLEFGLAPATALVAFLAIGCTAMRPGQNPAWRPAVGPVWAAGLAAFALALPGLSVLLGVHLPVSSLFIALCLIAAVLTWIAGLRIGRVDLDVLRYGADDDGADDWAEPDPWAAQYEQAGDFDADEGEGVYRGNGLYRPDDGDRSGTGYPDEAGYPAPDQAGYPAPGETEYLAPSGGYQAAGPRAGYGDVDYTGERDYGAAAPAAAAAGARPADWRAQAASAARPPDPFPPVADREAREQLFGQIAIYTLHEDRVADFDRLTGRLVDLVRSREPDTLVYIVHAVPSAPMQRILYEVYRDRAAFDEHSRQPYITRFEADRAPLVLATNVIELGLQQAKVSPFPSIDDLFPEPGYDTSGFERPDYSSYERPSASSGDQPGAPR